MLLSEGAQRHACHAARSPSSSSAGREGGSDDHYLNGAAVAAVLRAVALALRSETAPLACALRLRLVRRGARMCLKRAPKIPCMAKWGVPNQLIVCMLSESWYGGYQLATV